MRYNIILSALTLLPAFSSFAKAPKSSKPNVIFIIVDDSEFLEYGCYGGRVITPNIDKIARSGVICNNGYTSSSVSTPTRYTCMTGQYASRAESLQTEDHQTDDMSRFIRWNTHIESGQHNIASVLQQNGYNTGLAGKWHIGAGDYYYENIKNIDVPQSIKGDKKLDIEDPEVNEYLKKRYDLSVQDIKSSFGFDFVGGYYAGNLADIYPKSLMNFRVHNQDWITQNALEFIDQSMDEEKPFFLYFSTSLQHDDPSKSIVNDRRITPSGILESAPNVQPSGESVLQRVADAGLHKSAAASLWLDDGVGAILKKLEEQGILDNTAIFFFSDQQSYGKSTCYDGGIRTPYIFSWPSHIKADQTCNELVSNIDFAPTIFDICGVTPPDDMVLDGHTILPCMMDDPKPIRDALFFELGDMRAVRTKDYKYIAIRSYSEQEWNNMSEDVRKKQFYRQTYFKFKKEWGVYTEEHAKKSVISAWRFNHLKYSEDPDQLYDLRLDPSENMNLADNQKYSDVLTLMKEKLTVWLQTMPGTYWEFKK